MKKISIVFVVALFLNLFNFNSFGAATKVNVVVRGEALTMEVPPVVESGRTLVPLRAIFESLDAYVVWNANTKTITASRGKNQIELTIGKNKAFVNNKEIKLDTPAKIQNGRTLVPLRFVGESLGADVEWNSKSRTATISVDNTKETRGNTESSLLNGGFVGASDGWIYVSYYKDGLWKISDDGTKKLKISDTAVNSINIVGEWIYYSNSVFSNEDEKSRLFKMKTDGSSKEKITKVMTEFVSVVDDWIYYVNIDDNRRPYKMLLDGRANQKISDKSVESMTVEDGWIYFVMTDSICKMRTNGTDFKTICKDLGENIVMSKMGNSLYYTSDETYGMYKINKYGIGKKQMVDDFVINISSYDGYVYYIDDINNLYKVKEDGTEKKKIVGNISGVIHALGDWVYYTAYLSDNTAADVAREYRVKTDGTLKQRLDIGEGLENIYITSKGKEGFEPNPVNISDVSSNSRVLTTKEIAKFKDTVVYIKIYDENGKQFASGSGFVIHNSGIVVTNYHVVSGASEIKCSINIGGENKIYDVEHILNYDTAKDIAIIKLKNASDLPVVKLADSDQVELAEDVVAIGNPMELQNTISTGIVSGMRNMFGIDYIQTTAAISPGSSGGPLFNSKGEVIGMTTLTVLNSQNINFAVTSNNVKSLFTTAAKIPVSIITYYDSYIEESEPNNTVDKGNEFIPTQTIEGGIEDNKDVDYYKFSLEEAHKVSLFATMYNFGYSSEQVKNINMSIVDENGKKIATSELVMENDVDTQKIVTKLEAGTYYIEIKKSESTSVGVEVRNYSIYTVLD